MSQSDYLLAGDHVIALSAVTWADFSEIENLRVRLYHDGTSSMATNIQAIEAALYLKPSVLEGKRMRWHRHVWAFHNLVAHPLMQVLALFGLGKLGLTIHDKTVPRPRED